MVNEATIRVDTFNAIFDLIDANKLSGWTVYSEFPEVETSFPCIVISPIEDNPKAVTLNRSKRIHTINMTIDVYTNIEDNKILNDQGLDNIQDTIFSNLDTLEAERLFILEDSFVSSPPQTFDLNDKLVNLGSVNLGLKHG